VNASQRYSGTLPPRDTAAPRLAGLQARAREGAAERSGGYSSFVGIMRYGLPLAALLLLSLVVIWPLVTGREEGFRISFSDSPDLDGSLRMVNARYLGADDRDQPYTVTAAEVSQTEPNSPLVTLKEVSADVFLEDGGAQWFALSAREGLYERDQRFLDLIGDVSIFSDQGHEFHTERAHVDLAGRTADGDLPVQGQGPLGLLQAGNFHVDNGEETMFFEGGVTMTIFPGGQGGK